MEVATTSSWSGLTRLEAIYDAMGDTVYRFVLIRCGDPVVAADVTSEVFLSAARAFGGDNPDQVTSSWLLTVARRRLVDHWRSDASRRRLAERLRSELSVVRPEETDLADVAIGDEPDPERMATALDALNSRERAAITLRYLDDCSVDQVASMLDTTYAAAESLLGRARMKFRRAWGAS